MSTSRNEKLLCANCHDVLRQPDSVADKAWKPHAGCLNALLKSDQPLSHQESVWMHVSLSDSQHRLSIINRQLDTLENRRLCLQNEKKDLIQYISDQKGVLHPIRSFPFESLANIFQASIDEVTHPNRRNDDLTYDDPLNTESIRWVITHVCRRWRAVSLSSPSLWTNIQLMFSQTGGKSKLLLLNLHLQRAQKHPLTIGLYYKYRTRHPLHRNYLLMTLLPSAPRWRHLYLDMGIEDIQGCFSHIQHFLSSPLTNLQTLALYSDEDSDDDFLVESCNIFKNTVSLQALTVISNQNFVWMKLHWDSISHLELKSVRTSISRLISILRQTSHLKELILAGDILDPFDDIIDTPRALHLPHLRKLVLRVDEEQYGSHQLLNSLSVSSLHSLIDNGEVGFAKSGAYHALLSDCKQLVGLELVNVSISDNDFRRFIKQHLHLQTLSFNCLSSLTTSTIKLLIYRPNERCPLPLLQTLSLGGAMSFDAALFVDMVESRLRVYKDRKVARMFSVKLEHREDNEVYINGFDRFEDPFFKDLEFSMYF